MLKNISTAGQSLAQLQNQWQVRVWDPGAYKGDAIEKCELHNFCIDLCSMHKIDAKLKREEAWRMIVENHHILASAKLMPSVYVEKHNILAGARTRVAQASISEWLVHQHIEVFHPWCGIFSECESQVKQMLMHSVQKKVQQNKYLNSILNVHTRWAIFVK